MTEHPPVWLIPQSEFSRIHDAVADTNTRLAALADMCRLNVLAIVKRAGSGHLGSSLSSMDIVARLYWHEMNIRRLGTDDPNRDVYFSSKGHDVPALYTVLNSLSIVPTEKLLLLRRYGGLEGHPDIATPGIEANSGSLGMGISKGRGIAWAKRRLGKGGRVFVMTGDGEWQEGQNFEALQAAVQQNVANLTVIVDHNKVQSDKYVNDIVSLGDLEAKFSAFGWFVARCDGNNQDSLEQAFAQLAAVSDRPKILIADTIKGCGVSFMEHPRAMSAGGLYPWHAGAPDDDAYRRAVREVEDRLNARLAGSGIIPPQKHEIPPPPSLDPTYSLDGEPVSIAMPRVSKADSEFVAKAYGEAILAAAKRRPDVVVLDADLAADCKIRAVENECPGQFIECGIAEQDMVSMAGGLARMGLLPVVNSFASFLASRSNEQIYNNASEKTKIIYACHYSGLIPAGPGKSHQSIRDISLFGALPNVIVLQPANSKECRMVVDYAIDKATVNVAIRLAIGPSPRKIALPDDYELIEGRGIMLCPGSDAVLFAYGPVMLHEALLASEILRTRGIHLSVINMPWLNRFDEEWIMDLVTSHRNISVLDDHAPVGGLADRLRIFLLDRGALTSRRIRAYAVESYPAFGTPTEALLHHRLDGCSLASQIRATLH